LEAIRFAELYPNEVVGLVSLDGGSPEYYSQQEPSTSPLEFLAYSGLRAVGIARFAIAHLGVLNRYLVAQNGLREVPPDIRDTYRVLAITNLGSAAIRAEANQLRENARRTWSQWQVTGTNRRLPLRVLTADASVREESSWLESQRSFAAESTDGIQITLENTRHSMQHFAPDAICRVIETLAEAVKPREPDVRR
jgi:hypothetical protein